MPVTFKEKVNRQIGCKLPEGRIEFLMQTNDMKGEYLGECLDSIRWGGQRTVMYEFGTTGLINFIQHWMKLNKGNLIWTDKQPSEKFALPYIKHDKCPANEEHIKTITDLAGRVRCAHKSRIFYEISDMNTEQYSELVPDCYAILSDEKSILSLEIVLDRLNIKPRMKTVYCHEIGPCERLDELSNWARESSETTTICPGHLEENNKTVHPFCGWTLAWYVQKWYEQVSNGQVPVFEKTN